MIESCSSGFGHENVTQSAKSAQIVQKHSPMVNSLGFALKALVATKFADFYTYWGRAVAPIAIRRGRRRPHARSSVSACSPSAGPFRDGRGRRGRSGCTLFGRCPAITSTGAFREGLTDLILLRLRRIEECLLSPG